MGRKRLKERETRILGNERRLISPILLGVLTMNTLNLIRKQINKAAALHDAQINHTAYRGVEYDTRCVESKETHGTFCYRGKTYTK